MFIRFTLHGGPYSVWRFNSQDCLVKIGQAHMARERSCIVGCVITLVALFFQFSSQGFLVKISKAHMARQRACTVGCVITLVAFFPVQFTGLSGAKLTWFSHWSEH